MNLIHRIKKYKHRKLSSDIRVTWGITCLLFSLNVLSGCSDWINEPTVPEEKEISTGYYLSLTVLTPNQKSSRSTTTTGGNASDNPQNDSKNDRLPGTDLENQISSATIYLVDATENSETFNHILFEVEAEEIERTASETHLIAEIKDIKQITALSGKTLKVFVVGNVKESNLSHNFSLTTGTSNTENVIDAIFSIPDLNSTNSPIGYFGKEGRVLPLVNSSDDITLTIPKGSSDTDILKNVVGMFTPKPNNEAWLVVSSFNSDKALNLERAVARLEYQDAIRTSGTLPNIKNVYPVTSTEDALLELYTLQPFNINQNSNLFRHTAQGDLSAATEAHELLKVERGSVDGQYNWISGPSNDWGYTEATHSYAKSKNFYNALSLNSTDEEYRYYEIKNGSAKSTQGMVYIDEIENVFNSSSTDNDGYHPFYYVSENTLPSIDLMKDVNDAGNLVAAAYATGVAFTFKVLGKDNKPLVYEDTPGGNDSKYPSCVTNSTTNSDKISNKWITITDKSGNWIDVSPTKVTETVPDPDSSEEGATKQVEKIYYLITYIGCIVHNDGGNGIKAEGKDIPPMYYGVVRNNTYQLSVKSVSSLPNPNDPKTLYLKIDIKVLPWTVRNNDIEF